jgi:hypothetical protein
VIAVLGVAFGVLSVVLISLYNDIHAQSNLEKECEKRSNTISTHARIFADRLSSAAAFVDSVPKRMAFNPSFDGNLSRFTLISFLQNSYFSEVELIERVLDQDREYFETVSPRLKIVDLQGQSASNASDYYVSVASSLPRSDGPLVDLGSDLVERDYIFRSIRDFVSVFSLPFQCSRRCQNFNETKFTITSPLYRDNLNVASTGEDRLASVLGVVRGHVLGSNLIQRSFLDLEALPMLIRIIELRNNSEQLFFQYFDGQEVNEDTVSHLDLRWDSLVSFSLPVPQYLFIQCIASEHLHDSWAVLQWYWQLVISLAILAFFLCLSWITYLQKSRVVQVEKEVSQRTRDLTTALEMLDSAKAESEQANTSKSAFLAFLCHELRNPLHSIVATTDFMSSTSLNAQQQSYVSSLSSSCSLMVNS